MPQGNNANITVNIFLDAASRAARSFGLILLIVPLTANSLDGERVVEYASLADAQDAETAGFISADTLVAITAMFAQPTQPEAVLVGYRNDSGSPETWAAAITAIRALRDDWYAVAIGTHTDVAIVAVSDAIESITPGRLFMGLSTDTSWLDSGVPAGFTTIVDNERTAMLWHDDADSGGDAAYLANRLGFDPDAQSVPWQSAPLIGVAEYATPITDTQRSFAIANNINILADYGSYSNVTDPGRTLTGRPVEQIQSGDWLEARIKEAIADLAVTRSARGQKIPVSPVGQGLVQGVIEGWLQQGVAAGHFIEGQTSCVPQDITTADITNQRLRFKVAAQLAVSARPYTIDINLQQTAVNEA